MNYRSRLPALLSGLALAFTVTACGHVDSEPEPNIDYEGFAESVAELPRRRIGRIGRRWRRIRRGDLR